LQQAPGLNLQWRGLPRPLLNGRELPQALQDGDQLRSVAVAADGSRFAMGTDWRVALFDREGRLLWAQQPPSSTWTVALSADGRYLVSGHGDGSIRWRDTSDGREVLALFLHTDGQRWVAWTPEGFFDASPGGEQLIGHHLNRGADRTGDFISAAQLRERYFQPALVSRRLEPAGPVLMGIATRSLGDIRQLLGTQAGQPPQVQLLAADASAGDVNVQVKVNDQGGGLGNLTFYLDGKPMEGRQAGVVTDGTVSRSFSLPPGRYKLEVAASSRGGVEGPRVARDLVVSGAQAPAALHVLAIGVEKYRDTQLELKNSANDATRLGAELSQRAKPLFPRGVNLRVLRDDQASLGGIEAAFAQLRAQFKPEDTLVIFLAGHGESSPRGGYVFLPWDFERGAAGPRGQGLDEARLQAMLASSPRNTLLLIDTCEAGSAQDMVAGAYRRLNGLTQHVLIGASRKGELAREGYNGHGVFTAALLETLARKPEDAGDRQLSVVELSALVEKSVSRIARTMPGYQQRVSGFLGSARFPVVAR
jgi:Caspase domain